MPIVERIGKSLASLGARLMGKRLTSGGQWPGDDSTRAFLDAMGVVRQPSAGDMVREFEGIAYTCAMENAKAVASVGFKLFVTTGAGEKRAKCATRSVNSATMKRLAARRDLRRRMAKAVVVEEVEDHPLLDWLYSGGQQVWLQSSLYLDVVGQAFWRLGRVEGGLLDGMPLRLDVMPAHEIAPVEGKTIEEALAGWKWGRQTFAAEELVWFRWPSLTKPWTGCYSPTRAAWTDILLGDKAASHLHDALDKAPPVSYIVSPAGQPNAMPMDAQMGEGPLKRLDEDLKRKLFVRRQRVIVAGIPLNVQTFAENTRELELAVQRGFSREVVAMCFGVPPAMLTTSTNLDNLKAAMRQHAKQAVEPRCILFDEAINQQVVPWFDPSGRLFVAHDDCVPQDVASDVQRETADAANGTRSINEMREDRGLEPIEGGDEPLVATGRAPLSQVVARDLNAMQSLFGAPRPQPAAPQEERRPEAEEKPEPEAEEDDRETRERMRKGEDSLNHHAACECTMCKAASRKQAPAEGDAGNPAVNVHGLPDGRALEGVIRAVARRQRKAVLKAVQEEFKGAAKGKKQIELPGINWAEWDAEFSKAAAPVLEIYAERGAREAIVRLGATDEEAAWRVQLPQVREAIRQAAMRFAESTNATTSMELDAAIAELRRQLEEGILAGENTLRDLTRRVEGVFDRLERDRARMIALTESSRAVHQGQLIAAEQSGVVAGMRWLAHPGACPLCQELAGQEVSLGEAFADDGKGSEYSVTTMPPLHPNCLCSVTEVLKPIGELLANADEVGEGFKATANPANRRESERGQDR